ncbi:MAG: flagellar hook-basal body complex protein [Bilophila sp.]
MSLTASMWTGVSGLLTHGEKMNVIGNNIANVNTVGFRGQRMDFEDFMYQNSYSGAGITQIGRGVSVGAVMGDFGQGSFETTTEVTDLAIGGRGFFKVKPQGNDLEYYTRAGNFRFSKAGYLNDPNGYTLQGWKIDNTAAPERASGGFAPATNSSQIKGTGIPTDVKLDTWTVQPLQTTKVSASVNLPKGEDKSRYTGHPFTSLIENWNGSQPPVKNRPYLSESQYTGSPLTIEVYDEAGGTHTLSVYFDSVNPEDYADGNPSQPMWEYVVTMDPAEDMREISVPKNTAWYEASALKGTGKDYTCSEACTINGVNYAKGAVIPAADINDDTKIPPYVTDPVAPADGGFKITKMKDTKQAGVLMSGTMTFDSTGKLMNQSAYVMNGSKKPVVVQGTTDQFRPGNGYTIDGAGNPVPIMNPENPASYMYATEVSSAGYPMLVANFTAIPGAHSVGSVPDADRYLIEMDFGLRTSNLEKPWINNGLSLAETNGSNSGADSDVFNKIVKNPDPLTLGTIPYVYENTTYSDKAYLDLSNTNPPPADLNDQLAKIAKYKGGAAAIAGTIPNQTVTWTIPATAPAAVPSKASDLSTITDPVIKGANAFTNYAKSEFVVGSKSQNGYGYGDLTNYSVNNEGILSGIYSNGVTLPLYQITLYDFTCKQGMRREGGNLFSQTLESGDAASAAAGSSGFGTISAQTLEGSNVDLSREFVQMISTQRGFRSNSKMITTVDTMLETVINMKR